MGGEPSLDDALRLLGLTGPADRETLAHAFRIAALASHPDRPGGDAARFRAVTAAYRQARAAAPRQVAPVTEPPLSALAPPAAPVAVLTPLQALRGDRLIVRHDGRALRVTAPAGLRSGETLRLRGADDGRDLLLPVLIRPADGLSVLGDDLFMEQAVTPRRLIDGGRLSIDTYAGSRDAWLVGGLAPPVRLRLRDLGLPPRGDRPQGHLFVTLIPAADAPSEAEDRLARFTRLWTPQRQAA